jgi:hypothetical protein
LVAFSIAPVRAAQMSRTRKDTTMATFVGNRAIKRLAQEDYEVITVPFSGRAKVASDLVRSKTTLKPHEGDSSHECDNFQADRARDGKVNHVRTALFS